MSDTNEHEQIINFLCTSIFDVQGRLRANEVITNAIVKVICSNAPQLIEQLKETISDTAELGVNMGELPTQMEAEIFQREIEQCILRFSLYEDSAKYNQTAIEVKSK
jgi:hypothetical protein